MEDDLDRAAINLMREVITSDPLLTAIGRTIAPQVNAALANYDTGVKPLQKKAQKVTYCSGCGEPSSWVPDLCPECLAVNAGTPT